MKVRIDVDSAVFRIETADKSLPGDVGIRIATSDPELIWVGPRVAEALGLLLIAAARNE